MSSRTTISGNHGDINEPFMDHRRRTLHARSASPYIQRDVESAKECTISLRAVIGGLLIGTMICFANLYFLLQAGLNNSMPLPSALLGYVIFQPVSKYLRTPYSPMENVLVMTIAASMGAMPVTAGLDGIIPALEYLITPMENGPLTFTLSELIIWSSGVCLFGIVFATPLRYVFVLHDPLRFPTGTAMAMVIGLLHRRPDVAARIARDQSQEKADRTLEFREPLSATDWREDPPSGNDQSNQANNETRICENEGDSRGKSHTGSDTHRSKLTMSFGFSSFAVSLESIFSLTLCAYADPFHRL